MPLLSRASLLSPVMADDVNEFIDSPAPLPPHDRPWRHPSELAAHERFLSRLSSPRTSTSLKVTAGGLALALIVSVCFLIAPRNAPRETPQAIRNAATLSGRPFASPVAATAPGDVPLIALQNVKISTTTSDRQASRFIAVTSPGTAAIDITSAQLVENGTIELRTLRRDDALGLTLLESPTPLPSSGPIVSLATKVPTAGESVILLTAAPVAVQVGVSVTADNSLFVPLSDMVITLTGKSIRTLPDGLPLVNSRNELVGLLVHKGNAIGFIPSSAIEEFVLRLNA
mgnify:FL=1